MRGDGQAESREFIRGVTLLQACMLGRSDIGSFREVEGSGNLPCWIRSRNTHSFR